MSNLHKQALKIAAALPKGDPTRRELLATLKEARVWGTGASWKPHVKKLARTVEQTYGDAKDLADHIELETPDSREFSQVVRLIEAAAKQLGAVTITMRDAVRQF